MLAGCSGGGGGGGIKIDADGKVTGTVGKPKHTVSGSTRFGGEAVMGEGLCDAGSCFVLSKHADHSSDYRDFYGGDTLFMAVRAEMLDPYFVESASAVMTDAAIGVSLSVHLVNNGDLTYSAAVQIADLPTAGSSWTWAATIVERDVASAVASAAFTVSLESASY